MPQSGRKSVSVLVLTIILLAAASSFAIVWMQQQISHSAQNGKQLKFELVKVERELRELDRQIAIRHQPMYLKEQINESFRPALEDQIVWVREQKLVNRYSYTVLQPYEMSPPLASLERRSSEP